ncbi:MAG: sodium:alanine symporter family protein [Parachlamydiales bacterium]|nr:sodium:alanine symporter family protein [Parachlamydiales bacterium]
MDELFSVLNNFNNFIWGYFALFIILTLGIYLTIKSKYFQIKHFPKTMKIFLNSFKDDKSKNNGLSPIKTLFTAIGGSIGIGNIVGICTAIQIGGPGAIFWTWIAGFLGMIIQYSEVFLGMKYRKQNNDSSFSGGPMHFFPKAFKKKWTAYFAAVLLSLYGIEIFLFNVVKDSISINWNINKTLLTVILIILIFLATLGGVKRVSKIINTILPFFLVSYIIMILFVIFKNYSDIPSMMELIFKSAFTPQAAKGAFAGSTIILTISMGLSRGAYAAELGVGYNSVIHSQSNTKNINKQAALSTFGVFFNTFVLCSLASFAVIITGKWNLEKNSTIMLQSALSNSFGYMHIFMPVFLFLLGYITIITIFIVGIKCAEFISKKYGRILYYCYAAFSLFIFSFLDPIKSFALMSIIGAILLISNLMAIFFLRKEINFEQIED